MCVGILKIMKIPNAFSYGTYKASPLKEILFNSNITIGRLMQEISMEITASKLCPYPKRMQILKLSTHSKSSKEGNRD